MNDKPKISIRKAVNGDIDRMTELLEELFSIEADFQFDAAKQRTGLEMIINSGAGSFILVAEYSGQVVAMCSLQTVISTAQGRKAGIIEDMVVGSRFRGMGIGAALLAEMEKQAVAMGIDRIQLLADKNNTPALEFYAKSGWTATELICLRKYLGTK